MVLLEKGHAMSREKLQAACDLAEARLNEPDALEKVNALMKEITLAGGTISTLPAGNETLILITIKGVSVRAQHKDCFRATVDVARELLALMPENSE
jgi:hypothetical protein